MVSRVERVVLAIGFFDGIHLGHLSLLNKAIERAKLINCETAVFTFGDDFFQIRNIPTQLIDLKFEKEQKLKMLGINNIYFANPTTKFLQMTADDFHNFLLATFNLEYVIIGSDFRYGKNAQNGANDLANFLSLHNVNVLIEPLLKINNVKISSESIRIFIKEGKLEQANKLLYSSYSLYGIVIKGRGEGHKYGVKTANIEIPCVKILPPPGVYSTKTHINGQCKKSLTHIGPCPTFNYYKHTIETLITDFDEDIYGEAIKIDFVKKIRENIMFPNKNELKNQIEMDLKSIINN